MKKRLKKGEGYPIGQANLLHLNKSMEITYLGRKRQPRGGDWFLLTVDNVIQGFLAPCNIQQVLPIGRLCLNYEESGRRMREEGLM